ncbi:hypothetical protein IMW63_02280 [Ehrlichia ruminantium]|uniref:hypothetical protein n=1 Tax=Ehrlichia ruminantium TaxID=779 RepID=UPI001FB32881|nr:hypothetical protein [Ehrlichia ruminantium]UOD99246.1 hypothetical protein IMW63_02280 [Ehrlichia ruminantium]
MFNQCQDNQANDNISYLCGIRRFTSILIGLVFLMFVLQIILWYFESKIAYSYTKLLINYIIMIVDICVRIFKRLNILILLIDRLCVYKKKKDGIVP